jgi:uncharacterized protein (DUF2164 family)
MMIGSSKQQLDKFGARVVKLARINLGARQKIDGKMRVTNNTGELSKSLAYRIKQKRTQTGQFSSGFDVEFVSDLLYSQFIEQGVQGSESTKVSALNSPFKFKSKNLPKGVMAGWIKSKPIRLREMGTGKFSKNTDQAKKQLAFVLGRAVATKGMSARHYFKDAVEQALPNDGGDIAVSIALNYIKKNLRS